MKPLNSLKSMASPLRVTTHPMEARALAIPRRKKNLCPRSVATNMYQLTMRRHSCMQANQPVAVTMDASGADFQFYSSGAFTGECGTEIDLGVTLVGYGTSNDKLKYWLIKNSWGTALRKKGYMRMLTDIKAKGMCGIAILATYPTM